MYDNKPKIPFEFRHKMSEWNQKILNERHEWWQITGCRKDFTCMNNECAVKVHSISTTTNTTTHLGDTYHTSLR